MISANDVLLVVSNDTNKTRTFKVFTSSGKSYDFEIEACPLNKDFGNMKFEEENEERDNLLQSD